MTIVSRLAWTLATTAVGGIGIVAASAEGQSTTQSTAGPPVTFKLFEEFQGLGNGQDVGILIDGTSASRPRRDAFPASFWAGQRCSATLVGERVLISAAHCFRGNSHVTLKLRNGDASGTCDYPPDLPNGSYGADLALCLMNKPIAVVFETVDVASGAVKLNDQVLLTGWGGNRLIGVGRYLVGSTTVTELKDGVMVTTGGAWTQPGDSGGAGFSSTGGHRRLVSVNSAVQADKKTSFAALLSAVTSFIDDWKREKQKTEKGVWICGLDPGTNCRD